jgi:hypothetical protein
MTEQADSSKLSVRVKIDVYVALFCLRESYTQPQTLHTLGPLVLPLCSRHRGRSLVLDEIAFSSILKIALNFDEISELTSRDSSILRIVVSFDEIASSSILRRARCRHLQAVRPT